MEGNNVFLTSDLWLYRHNAISIFSRPFENIEQMNNTLIENWNCTVGDDDIAVVLGGFNYDNTKYEMLLNTLRGKIVLLPLTTDILVFNQNVNFLRFNYSDIVSPLLNRFDDRMSTETLNGLQTLAISVAAEEKINSKLTKEEFMNQMYGVILKYMIAHNEVNAELADMLVELCSAMLYDGADGNKMLNDMRGAIKEKFENGNGAGDPCEAILNAVGVMPPMKYWARLEEGDDPFTMHSGSVLEIPEYGVVLSAYPLLDWNGKNKGVLNIHGGMVKSNLYEGRFNVRTDLCNFAPVSLSSIIELNKMVKRYNNDKKAY